MDLSAVIFVALALAWAGYLIPKALRHHDDVASDRLDESHTERVRVLRRKRDREVGAHVPIEVPVEADVPVAPAAAPVVVAEQPLTRTAARRAAGRRRRVLAVLLVALAAVAGLAAASYVPWWATAVPAGLIVLFLVVARASVRRAQRSSLARRRAVLESVEHVGAREPVVHVEPAEEVVVEGPTETAGTAPEPVVDDGSLWDPLPMNLPTYVNKARARRTVRTIELTGMHSSGHSAEDSALAREAAEQETVVPTESETRRVAGA